MGNKYIKFVPDIILFLGLFFAGDLVGSLKAFNDNDMGHVHGWVAWYFIAAVWLYALGMLVYRDLSAGPLPDAGVKMPKAILFYSGLPVGLIGMAIGCKIFVPLGILFFFLGWFGFGRLHYPVVGFDTSNKYELPNQILKEVVMTVLRFAVPRTFTQYYSRGRAGRGAPQKKSRIGRMVSSVALRNADTVSLLMNLSPLIIGGAVLLITILSGGAARLGKQWLFAVSYLEFILFAYLFGLTEYTGASRRPIFRPSTGSVRISVSIFGLVFLIPFMIGILATAQTILLDQAGSIKAFLRSEENDLIDQIAICAVGSMIAAALSGFMIYVPRAVVYLPFEKPPSIYIFVGMLFLIYFISIFFGQLHPISFFDWPF